MLTLPFQRLTDAKGWSGTMCSCTTTSLMCWTRARHLATRDDEINLLYVASTRAMRVLALNSAVEMVIRYIT